MVTYIHGLDSVISSSYLAPLLIHDRHHCLINDSPKSRGRACCIVLLCCIVLSDLCLLSLFAFCFCCSSPPDLISCLYVYVHSNLFANSTTTIMSAAVATPAKPPVAARLEAEAAEAKANAGLTKEELEKKLADAEARHAAALEEKVIIVTHTITLSLHTLLFIVPASM
jgi:hypothetical protein